MMANRSTSNHVLSVLRFLAVVELLLLPSSFAFAFAFVNNNKHSLTTTTTTTTTTRTPQLYSSRAPTGSTYDRPVAASGASWNDQRGWEGHAPSFEQEFGRNRNRMQQQQQQRVRDPNPSFPQQQPQPQPQPQMAAPMVRYSTLTGPEKDFLDATSTSTTTGGSAQRNNYYQRPDRDMMLMQRPEEEEEPVVELPPNSKDIQGGSRGTWSSDGRGGHDVVQVTMTTDGRPLQADVEVYQGPDNTPQRMRIYSEDGRHRPFTTMIQTPQGAAKTSTMFYNPYNLRDSAPAASMATGGSHSISVINRGPMEFPMAAGVEGKGTTDPEERASRMADYSGRSMGSMVGQNQEIHGGTLKTYPFDPSVASVEVRVQSQGLPIMAVVELWQGPGDVKTVAQIYCDDGRSKPFSAIIETPGTGNTIAIRNVGPTAYPIEAILDIYKIDDAAYSYSFNPTAAGGGVGGGVDRGASTAASDGLPFFGSY